MIKLYDFELSGSCYKVRMFLNILGQRYEPVTVDFVNKEHKTAKYTALNPGACQASCRFFYSADC